LSSSTKLIVALLLTQVAVGGSYAQQTAIYQLTFESNWSPATHPSNFPSNAHFSGLIGTTHNASVSYWTPGQVASGGIKQMAETGSKSELIQIFNTTDDSQLSDTRISEGGLGLSPGSLAFAFSASASHPLLTLVSMIAPSPDWFVGVSGLSLMDANGWIPSIEVDLYAYDAGTDSGESYASANLVTQPPVAISRLVESPFKVNGGVPRIGRFVLTRQSVTSVEDLPSAFRLFSAYPNPFMHEVTVEYELVGWENVRIDVFDLVGRRVETLFEGRVNPGRHQVRWPASEQNKGAYIIRLQSESQSSTQMVHLVK